MIEREDCQLSVRTQCRLLGVNRSTVYYQQQEVKPSDLEVMRLLDEQYTRTPHYGVAWTKQTQYLYDICLMGSGEFNWSIAVVRGTNGAWQADLSPEAPPRRFSSYRSDAWCRRHGRVVLGALR